MKNWLRVSGIGLLASITAIIAIIGWLYLGSWLTSAMQSAGGEINGATVDVDGVSFNPMAATLQISGIEVADPDALSFNRFELQRANLDLSISALMKGQFHASQLDIVGLRPFTERSKAAELIERGVWLPDEPWQYPRQIAAQSNDFDANDLLAEVDIQSPQQFADFSNRLDQYQVEWRVRRQGLPSQQQLASHKEAFDAAKQSLEQASGLAKLEAAKQLKKVIKAVKKDLDQFKAFKTQTSRDFRELQTEWTKLQEQVSSDTRLATQMLSLSPEGLNHLAAALIGESGAVWFERILQAYRLAQPWLAKENSAKLDGEEQEKSGETMLRRGRTYSFSEMPTLPDFYAAAVNLSGEFPMENQLVQVSGQAKNIASALIPELPMEGELTWRMAQPSSTRPVDGMLSFQVTTPESASSEASADFSINQWPLADWSVSESGLRLKQANITMEGRVIATAERLELSAHILISAIQLDDFPENTAQAISVLADSLSQRGELNLAASFIVEKDDTKLTLRSDIDELVASEIRAGWQRQVAEAKERVEQSLDDQLAGVRSKVEQQLAGISGLEKGIQQEIERLNTYR